MSDRPLYLSGGAFIARTNFSQQNFPWIRILVEYPAPVDRATGVVFFLDIPQMLQDRRPLNRNCRDNHGPTMDSCHADMSPAQTRACRPFPCYSRDDQDSFILRNTVRSKPRLASRITVKSARRSFAVMSCISFNLFPLFHLPCGLSIRVVKPQPNCGSCR